MKDEKRGRNLLRNWEFEFDLEDYLPSEMMERYVYAPSVYNSSFHDEQSDYEKFVTEELFAVVFAFKQASKMKKSFMIDAVPFFMSGILYSFDDEGFLKLNSKFCSSYIVKVVYDPELGHIVYDDKDNNFVLRGPSTNLWYMRRAYPKYEVEMEKLPSDKKMEMIRKYCF